MIDPWPFLHTTVEDVIMAGQLWQDTLVCSAWQPVFLYCGEYNNNKVGFSLMNSNRPVLRVPAKCRFGLQFLSHIIYCLWAALLDSCLPLIMQKFSRRVESYADGLWLKFLNEVLVHCHRPGTWLGIDAILNPRMTGFTTYTDWEQWRNRCHVNQILFEELPAEGVENPDIFHSDILILIPDSRMVYNLIFTLFILLTISR